MRRVSVGHGTWLGLGLGLGLGLANPSPNPSPNPNPNPNPNHCTRVAEDLERDDRLVRLSGPACAVYEAAAPAPGQG